MAHKNKLDPNFIKKLRQHYHVTPEPEFMTTLKSELMDRFSAEERTEPKLKPRRVAMALVGTFVALVIVFFATPTGRSLAQEYINSLQYFQRAESYIRPHSTEVIASATARAEIRATEAQFATEHPEIPTATPANTPTRQPGFNWGFYKNVAEIEKVLGFDVLEPGWLPDNNYVSFFINEVDADLEKGIAVQFYGIGSTNGLRIEQYPVDLEIELPVIGATQFIRFVDINGYAGEYIIGGWNGTDKGWVWDKDPYRQRMRWEQDGMIFEFSYFGPVGTVTMEDLIAIAESMQ